MPNLFRATPQPSSDRRPLRSKANQHGGRAFWRPPTGTRDATNNPQRLHDQHHSGQSGRVAADERFDMWEASTRYLEDARLALPDADETKLGLYREYLDHNEIG